MPDEPGETPPEPETREPETPATPEPARDGGHAAWESRTEAALKLALETQQSVNQALSLQARRMDDLAKLHESHTRQWEESLAETRELMKAAREAMAAADQARGELVSVTAAQVKIAQTMQATLQALQEESQS